MLYRAAQQCPIKRAFVGKCKANAAASAMRVAGRLQRTAYDILRALP
jgi:hypothetical protein